MSSIRTERDGAICVVTFTDAARRNPLSPALVSTLIEILEEARHDATVRALVFHGEGTAFSAGADLAALKQLQTATSEENLADSRRLAQLFSGIYLHPKPILAAVNGHALGGGCGLVVACDCAISHPEAKLGFTEVRLGFIPAIVSVFALHKLGEQRARMLMLRGHQVQGEEALQAGLVAEVVPQDRVLPRTMELAHEIATSTSASAIAQTKALLAQVGRSGLHEALEYAVQANALARTTSDFKAGIHAFLSRTEPPWRTPS